MESDFKSDFHKLSTLEKRELIFTTIDDLIADFLYYDRKEDSTLGIEDIETAVRDGVITVQEIIDSFSEHIEHNLT